MAGEDGEVERFHPTSGRVVGVVALLATAGVLVVGIVDAPNGIPLGLVPGCLLAALLIWAVLLRPAVRVEGGDLVLRGAFDTRWVPLAAIDRVSVGVLLVALVGDRRYASSAIGRSRREARRDDRSGAGSDSGVNPANQSYGGFVQGRLERLVDDARAQGKPAGAVRRAWAWPELAGIAVLAVAFVVALVV
jgi:hypothetical protein